MDSESDIEFVDKDSGMSSLGGSKDETPERRPMIVIFDTIFSHNFYLWIFHFDYLC